jgi:hypothetical protein
VVVAGYASGRLMRGQVYVPQLDYLDATTLLMICGLIVAGLVALRRCSDLQAVAFAWVVAVSCLMAYEALYKWSFYLAPFGRDLPAPEVRALVLQLSVAATLLTGFADRHLSVTIRTWAWLTVFSSLWVLWLLVGFPQLDGHIVHPPAVSWQFDREMVYLVNRSSKLALFITYYTLLPIHGARGRETNSADVAFGSP